jgi:hypothetical protein
MTRACTAAGEAEAPDETAQFYADMPGFADTLLTEVPRGNLLHTLPPSLSLSLRRR